MKILITLLLFMLALPVMAQKKVNYMYQFGIADAFLAGLYHGTLSVKEMKQHGNFGLGAPDILDGELVILDGKAYQTKSAGTTTVMPDTAKVPLVLLTFFKADTAFAITSATDKKAVFAAIDKYLTKTNGLYAIRISGSFNLIKTRAFPKLVQEPYLPLASMLDKQRFFTFEKIRGTLLGFKLPQYLSSVTIADYHFHFLSDDKTRGGHMTDVNADNVQIEIALLKGIDIQIPQDSNFMNFDFRKVKKGDAEKAEKQ